MSSPAPRRESAPAMTDIEALMWRLERDRRLSSTFSNVAILDRRPDVDRLRARLIDASRRIPRLRQRVDERPGGRAPRWVLDDELDIPSHVHHVALPGAATHRQLYDLATRLTADPFDPSRPLWRFTVIDGLPEGRSALLQKVHHSITDGEGGIELALAYLDLERNPPATHEPPTHDNTTDPTTGGIDIEPPDGSSSIDEPAPDVDDTAEAVRRTLANALRVPLGIGRRVQQLLANPDALGEASDAAGRTLDEIGREFGAHARSPLWTSRSTRRTLHTTSASVDDLKAVASRLGGTVNTAFVAAAADAAGDYHRRAGSPIDALRASIAVSTRRAESGSNAFTLARFDVPTGDMPVADRFAAVAAAVAHARAAGSDSLVDAAAALGAALPTSLIGRFALAQSRSVDVATSNVRGAPVDTYVAGAHVVANVPIGPLLGVPVNLTALSQRNRFDVGIHMDPAAIAEPDLFARCVDAAFVRLLSA
ncbi:MAG: wax ester/triacylglycerol synthase domain-containing protein [Actinomycetota bacterium]